MATNTFTRWSVIASGEGGGRVASQFFERAENPGIDERILVMNTNRSDLRNTIDRLEEHIGPSDDEDQLMGNHAIEFGSQAGAGNFFPNGEACAREDIDRIVNNISNLAGNTDAFMHIATLGGGTGNGSIPYIIDQFKNGLPDAVDENVEDWMGSVIHAAFGIWPYYYEQPQRHFNAVCGLSRLLRTGNERQNADMVLLASNSHLEDSDSEGDDQYGSINNAIIRAIDLMIGAGRETRSVIDIKDYVTIPSQMDTYHFTPAVSTGLDGSVFELEYMLEKASENAYVPMDVETTQAAYAIVRAPEAMIDNDEISEPDVYDAFRDWTSSHGLNVAGQASLTPKRGRGSDVDVLLLLGGFSLDPLLDHSWDDFEMLGESLSGSGSGKSKLTRAELDRIVSNLEEYADHNIGK
ncbi:FtsZ family protein, noncanonical [Natronomonas moolapensis 8.8.11]|uniref:FtsZ family protein, noncanonical n=1 Tax=Natronomonas moolapensis (strain DSM 18674 / CECT 7526 / JCM 14361 / 8.8.11) TaxID=268739 RepID=M1XS08_NATM8|nr:cell division protein FtsZ [Natronomonas moolapensis]CCQ37090.1 FtsZ family protein, noncanonical [Natronomonas moolapensis 8.8.11]